MQHKGTNATIVAAHFISAVKANPLEEGFVSVVYIAGGVPGLLDIIPTEVRVGGRTRSFKADVEDRLEQRLEEIAHATTATYNCEDDIACQRGYPPTVRTPDQVETALIAPKEALGNDQVIENM